MPHSLTADGLGCRVDYYQTLSGQRAALNEMNWLTLVVVVVVVAVVAVVGVVGVVAFALLFMHCASVLCWAGLYTCKRYDGKRCEN